MFFIASKIVWTLLSPAAFVWLLFLAGVVFLLFSMTRTALCLIFTGIFIYCTLGVLPVGPDMVAKLENLYERPAKLPANVAGIVVLGGSFETELSERHGFPVATANIERVLDGIRLAKAYPHARLVFSGGEGSLLHQDHPESRDVALFMQEYGLTPVQGAIYEEKSRNTLENLQFTHDLVKPRKGQVWLLVTSAWHMKRAMIAARKAGWGNIVPYPTDYRTSGEMAGFNQMFNIAHNFFLADMALHEYAGILAYEFVKKGPARPK